MSNTSGDRESLGGKATGGDGLKATFTLEGFSELAAQFKALEQLASEAICRGAAKAGAATWLEPARSMAPVAPSDDPQSGSLRDSIKVAVVVPKNGRIVASAGLKVGRRTLKGEFTTTLDTEDGEITITKTSKTVDAGFRWHFAELGTADQAAHPFLRPAFDAHSREAIEAVRAYLAKRIKAVAKRQARAAAAAAAESAA